MWLHNFANHLEKLIRDFIKLWVKVLCVYSYLFVDFCFCYCVRYAGSEVYTINRALRSITSLVNWTKDRRDVEVLNIQGNSNWRMMVTLSVESQLGHAHDGSVEQTECATNLCAPYSARMPESNLILQQSGIEIYPYKYMYVELQTLHTMLSHIYTNPPAKFIP